MNLYFLFSTFSPWDIVPFQKVSSVTSDLTLKRLIRFCHWTLRICQGAGGSWHRRKASWQTVLLTNTQTKPEVIWSKSQVKSIFKANHVRSQIAVRLKEKVKSQVIQSSKQWLKSKVTQVTQVFVCFIHCVSWWHLYKICNYILIFTLGVGGDGGEVTGELAANRARVLPVCL